ncbi:MAG: peptidoglycan recognition family protein [Actinomycetes bacterium]
MTRGRTGRQLVVALVLLAALGGAGVGVGPASARATDTPASVVSRSTSGLRPTIVSKPIPFGHHRQHQMGAYSKRHYGHWSYRLRNPRVIVEHYTDGPSMLSAWWTMANNSPNLGEKPGVCTHYIVDTDGRIYSTVPLRFRCRHTIGLNQTAIGIEHVGTSDRAVMGNARQRHASMRLTLWLMARFDIPVRNVIGHGESLMHPLRFELYPSWKCLTHTDFSHRTMRGYRARLTKRAMAAGVRVGGNPRWVDLGC